MRQLKTFTKVIKLNPENINAYNNLGLIYRDKGEFDNAIENFTKAIELDPEDVIIRNNRGVVYRDKGELDLALEDH